MFVAELFENPQRNLVVIYPGRFQPFHKGHKAVYDYLSKKYGRDAVYIATSNKTDNLKSPFSFSDKVQFMAATGVPLDRVIESTQPYQVPELTSKLDPNSTIMIYAVSQKDMDEDPRFKSWTKKDGSPAHFQPLPNDLKDTLTFSKHSYIEVVPTFNFTVLGKPMTSASEIRAMYKQADDQTKQAIIKDLFGQFTPELKHILDTKLGSLSEGWKQKAAAAALAAGLGMGGTAHASDNPVADVLGAGLIGAHVVNNIKGMNKASLQGEFNQELRNIARGDKNHSALYQMGNKPKPIEQDPKATDQDARDRMMRGESAGVGVIASAKQKNDPRYKTSLTVDVHPDTPKQNRKALRLEGIVDLDRNDPMNSVTAPPEGFGSMPLRDWKKSLARRLKELSTELERYTDPKLIDKNLIWDKVTHLLDPKSPISVIARDIARSHQELEAIRSKGGPRSRGISQ